MSVTRVTSIHCDVCDDWSYGHDLSGHDTAESIRRYLKARGWGRLPGGQDRCDRCVVTNRMPPT